MKDKQTIGQWLNWDFEVNGNLYIRDKNGNLIYQECPSGFWDRRELNLNGIVIYYENSDGVITDNRTPKVKVIEYNGRKYQLIP